MGKLLSALLVAALVLIPLWVAARMGQSAQAACEVRHSAETCFYTLNR